MTDQPKAGSEMRIDRPCSACGDGDTEMKYHDHAMKAGAEEMRKLVAELRAARTAWHEDFGVPISREYVRFLSAIGAVEAALNSREFSGFICSQNHDSKHYAFDLSGAVTCLACLMNEPGAVVGIGDMRRSLFLNGECEWNGLVRDVTAQVEQAGMLVNPVEVFRLLAKRLKDDESRRQFVAALGTK